MDFSNKTVIITGAGNGIGKGIALLYAEKGANVVIADIGSIAGSQTVAGIKEHGGEALFVQTDVRLESDIIRLMEIANQTYGHIDILINNAGLSAFKSPYDLSIEEWNDIINTNLRSVFLGSREAAKYMRHNKEGWINSKYCLYKGHHVRTKFRSLCCFKRWNCCNYTCACNLIWQRTGLPLMLFPQVGLKQGIMKN